MKGFPNSSSFERTLIHLYVRTMRAIQEQRKQCQHEHVCITKQNTT
jgi:hypothetical protein